MTAVAASYGAEQLGDLPALTDGFSAAFLGAAAIAGAGALLAALTLRTGRPTATSGRRGGVPGDAVPDKVVL
ncbi:hypothetical protein GCM10022225_33510 [Plantactinospora mayteni]|uniref:MFS transporter n=1 Tax=Plantactinospora mayteni TaxID=566021 RepID=A0ABQ4EL63_9ACTN|nr:hypothetical protein [Plantactinospora mayteni]GIG95485.1 hypothetical protein Pma05_20580 [Plantactinospora mayteni]